MLNKLLFLSNNPKFSNILTHIYFNTSNIAAGRDYQADKIIFSNIPKLIQKISKITKSNKVLSESIMIFHNLLAKCSNSGYSEIIKYDPLRIFCEGLKNSNLDNILYFSTKGILNFLKNSSLIPKNQLINVDIEINSIFPLIEENANNLKKNDISEISVILLYKIKNFHMGIFEDYKTEEIIMRTDN